MLKGLAMQKAHDFATGRITRTGTGCSDLTINYSSYGPGGAGATMGYAIGRSPFGALVLAATAQGVSWIGIHRSPECLETELRKDYPKAIFVSDYFDAAGFLDEMMAALEDPNLGLQLPVDIQATPFQRSVWQELCAIPRGETRSYGELAKRLGKPSASRAVGHANGLNPLTIIIPCHRAIGADGSLTGYRWGLSIKQQLLKYEGALRATEALPLFSDSTPYNASPKIGPS